MLKFSLSFVLVAAILGGATPSPAAAKAQSSIGRGCTLDPFNHTMRCIDFDHCTSNSQGQTVCPVVVTSTRRAG